MCGRYALAGDFSEFTKEFDLEEVPGLLSRYNIAPSSGPGYEAPIITPQGLIFARFWYIPRWFDAPLHTLPHSFNARVETLTSKPFFRGAEPCLVPTSGFREFPGNKSHKRTVCFYRPLEAVAESENDAPRAAFFAFAGIRSMWIEPDSSQAIDTFAIITTRPSSLVEKYHDRMPLIIDKERYAAWLAPGAKLAELTSAADAISHAFPLACYEAETFGNNPRVEGIECIKKKRVQLSLF